MTINKPKQRFFYGYWVLLVTFLCLFFWAGLVQYSSSLYILPLSEEFGWGKIEIAVKEGKPVMVTVKRDIKLS